MARSSGQMSDGESLGAGPRGAMRIRWSVGTKIGAGYAVALLALVIVGIVTHASMKELAQTDVQIRSSSEIIKVLKQMQNHVTDVESGELGYLLTGEERYLKPCEAAIGLLEKDFETFKEMTKSDTQGQKLTAILKVDIGLKLDEVKETITLRKQKGFRTAREALQTDRAKGQMQNIRDHLRMASDRENQKLKTAYEKHASQAEKTRAVIILDIALSFVVLTIVGSLITRNISKPLKGITAAAERIAAGDLASKLRLRPTTRRDEIGVLTDVFRYMTRSLEELARRAGDIAAGKLSVAIKPKSEKDLLGNAFARMTEELRRSREELEEQVNVRTTQLRVINESLRQEIEGRKQAEEEIRQLAFYDSLTRLPNRRYFLEQLKNTLEGAKRYGRLVGLLYLDLDGFKNVNDTLGHGVGDRLLNQVGERLVEGVRSSDLVGRPDSDAAPAMSMPVGLSRLGGDEFTILLTEMSTPENAGKVARRVLSALSKPFFLDRREVLVTASIGIAVFPSDGQDVLTLMRNADTAMYQAKDQGRNGWQYYSEEMNVAAARRLQLETRLRRALERQEFSLCYQPIRDAVSGNVIGAEALLRWTDAEMGPVSPSEFVPIAEETGLILPIGDWVLRTACGQAHAWRAAGFRPIRIAVNVSSQQLKQSKLVETVARLLEETGLSPANLDLEFTESALIREDAVTTATIRGLKELGMGLALDDFGTGYSSLSYLRRVPFDRVKIDRFFVGEITSDAEGGKLVAAIITMAHSLDLGVVAEGVETLEQAEFLRRQGCDELQGFLFSQAVPPEEFLRFLEREKEVEA
jgi:predicted signal transduction protein with EAL and GGDEF domain/CHASE3 domain sensor protein